MGETVRFRAPSEQTVSAMTDALAQRGYQLVRSFDMQSALARHPEDCPCPHHGTAECACQYVVLLAYPLQNAGLAIAPHVLTAHSYEQMTLVTVHAEQGSGSADRQRVLAAVMEAAGGLLADARMDEQERR